MYSKDFIDIAFDITEEIKSCENAFDAVEPILKLIELNPDIDFGSPGPLVHFVEQFYGKGYEERLVQSIKRLPTNHTVWMLNRIVNGCTGKQKEYYINVLHEVLVSPNISKDLILKVKEFLSLHN